MTVFIEWDVVSGPAVASAKLAALGVSLRAGGFRKPLQRSVREVLVPEIERQFAVGGDPKWPDITDSTKETKMRRVGHTYPILVETGRLKKAATALARWHVKNDEATFTGLPGYAAYGTFHVTGTKYMPQRNWANWRDNTGDAVHQVFDEWVEEKIGAIF